MQSLKILLRVTLLSHGMMFHAVQVASKLTFEQVEETQECDHSSLSIWRTLFFTNSAQLSLEAFQFRTWRVLV